VIPTSEFVFKVFVGLIKIVSNYLFEFEKNLTGDYERPLIKST